MFSCIRAVRNGYFSLSKFGLSNRKSQCCHWLRIVTIPSVTVGVNNSGISLDALTFESFSIVSPAEALAAIVNVTRIKI